MAVSKKTSSFFISASIAPQILIYIKGDHKEFFMTDTTAQNQQTTSYVDDYAPPATRSDVAPAATARPMDDPAPADTVDTVPSSPSTNPTSSTKTDKKYGLR